MLVLFIIITSILLRDTFQSKKLKSLIATITNFVCGKPDNSESESQSFVLKQERGWVTNHRLIGEAVIAQEARAEVSKHRSCLLLCGVERNTFILSSLTFFPFRCDSMP